MATLGVPRVVAAIKKVQFVKLLKCHEYDGDMKKYFIQQIRYSHAGVRNAFHEIQGTKFSRLCLCNRNTATVQAIALSRLSSTSAVESSQNVVNLTEQGIATSVPDKIVEAPLAQNVVPSGITADSSALPLDTVVDVVQTVGEPSFASLGLGGWTPVGMVEQCLEFLHVTCDMPWWGAIALGTAVVRVTLFPLVILAQRNAAKMNNNLPQLQLIQMKMTEARQTGNQLEAARYAQELMLFMKEKDISPFRNMIVPLAQAPVFISFFMALRGMANLPVESLKHGGLFWFEDLTLPDQYYLLPIITSATLYLTIEIGTDSARLTAANMQVMKFVLRALPICIFPFTVNFPGAVLCYWVSSNFISLLQVGILKIPAVRDYCKIEPLVVHSKVSLPVKKQGFVDGFRESWNNMKITKELEERQRLDEMRFQKAGMGPIQKTYKYDPTRPRESVAAKKREQT
ncbi:mitochondrial inner membrane protein OXA1L [Anabrus simplex]|uniref:mitochondrial inner membrane protein OXA1L n=1 Tax=Anabrus simplex TaxID=316456 RepID=UPI0035A37411